MDFTDIDSPVNPLGVNGNTCYSYIVQSETDLSGAAPEGTIFYVKDTKSYYRFDTTLNGWTPTEFPFGFATVAMANANQVLTSAQYSRRIIVCTGALTADRTLTFPNIIGVEWLVINSTTGGFNIVCKRATGTTTLVPAGRQCAVIWDGTNMTPIRGCNGAGTLVLNGTTEVTVTFAGLIAGVVPRITRSTKGTSPGFIYFTALNTGVDFRVKSSDAGDDATCFWESYV